MEVANEVTQPFCFQVSIRVSWAEYVLQLQCTAVLCPFRSSSPVRRLGNGQSDERFAGKLERRTYVALQSALEDQLFSHGDVDGGDATKVERCSGRRREEIQRASRGLLVLLQVCLGSL